VYRERCGQHEASTLHNSATQPWLLTYLPDSLQAGASFDALFDSVPAAELQQAMEAVMRQREPRREIVKVD
jgi:hypothetical protein